ncbi:MAG TPA: Na+ dependent nucleoside transporter N-terminal domain-containing protein, partial [Longimicrobium sp.]
MPVLTRIRRLKWLLPLWLTAALLLTAGWYASAQDTARTTPPATGNGTSEIVRGAQTPESGIARDPATPTTRGNEQPATAGQPTAQERAQAARAEAAGGTLAERAVSLLGLVVFTLIAFLLSVNRRAVDWRLVAWGIGLQFIFALLILKTTAGYEFFDTANDMFNAMIGYTVEGAKFLFGNLVWNNVPVGAAPHNMAPIPAGGTWANTGAFFAFNVLPTIIFFSSLMTLLYHLGIMEWIVKGFGWVMMKTMRISGAESLSTAGNIFLGQTEAPLLVKPFIGTMTKSELHCIMVGGFGTVAGGVLAAYVGILVSYFPDIAGHLISASVMSAPACIAISKLMYPET